jgi:mono/diheme cytochrome c family protein
MKRVVIMGVAIAALTAFANPSAAARFFDRTTLDSVYTPAQATHGESLYKVSCAKCHALTLAGTDSGGPLVGKDFLGGWTGLTLDQLFKKTYETMPSDNPKSVPPKDVADILAYLLARNEYPSGRSVLSENPDSLKAIKIVSR